MLRSPPISPMNKLPLSRRQALALAALPFFTGCNRDTKKRIGVFPRDGRTSSGNPYMPARIRRLANRALRSSGTARRARPISTASLQIVDAMINKRLDAIALAPIDKKAMVNVVERAMKQNIPVIIFDSPVDTEQFVSQVATDNYKAGQIAAERMGQITGGKGKIAIVAVQAGAASTMAREQGFEDTVRSKFPGIEDPRQTLWGGVGRAVADGC